MQEVDPPEGSVICTAREVEARVEDSTFLDPPRHLAKEGL